MEPFGNLLGDQGGVAAGAVVDDDIHLDLILLGLVYDLGRVLDHFRIQHARDHFIEREGLGVGLFVTHPQGGDETDDCLFSRVEKLHSHLGKLFPEGRQPGPMGKYQSYPVLFQDIKDRGNPIGLGAKLNVVSFILRDLAKEFVQILGKFGNRDPVVLNVILLLEDNSLKAGAEDLHGRLIELFGENIRIQVVFVLDKGAPPSQLSGDVHLGSLEKNQIPFLHLLAIAFQDMVIWGRASLGFQKRAVEGVVDLKKGKVLKVFRYALDRQNFLGEVLVLDLMAPASDSFFISSRGVNLPDPPRIPVAGCADQDVRGEVAKFELPCFSFSHKIILSRFGDGNSGIGASLRRLLLVTKDRPPGNASVLPFEIDFGPWQVQNFIRSKIL